MAQVARVSKVAASRRKRSLFPSRAECCFQERLKEGLQRRVARQKNVALELELKLSPGPTFVGPG